MSLRILIVLFFAALAAGELRSSAQVQNEADPDNLRDILNNLKQEMMENVKSLREEYDGRIETLTQHNDIISKDNDEIRKENNVIRQENDVIRQDNDVISREIGVINTKLDAIQKENEAFRKENEAIRKDNADIKAHLINSVEEIEELKSHLSTSDEQVNDLRERIQDAEIQCEIRIRHVETTMRGQRSTKGQTQDAEMQLDNQKLTNHTDSQGFSTGLVAFLARIDGFTGSVSDHTTIPFDVVDLNIGNAYDPVNGVFTAPVSGIYEISYEALADNTCGSGDICVLLTINGVLLSQSCSEYVASAGTAVTVQLTAGDTVTVDVNSGSSCVVLHNGAYSNKFSGHLVYMII